MSAPAGEISAADAILAMDVVDTIRHDERMRDLELSDGDRRKANLARLRAFYRAQGVDVSDGVIERALERIRDDRLLHAPMPPGPRRVLALLYVRRRRYLIGAGAALTAIGLAFGAYRFGHYQIVERPKVVAELRLRERVDILLPQRLSSAVERAAAAAERLGDRAAQDEIAAAAREATAALSRDDAESATAGIERVERVGYLLTRRESAARLTEEAEAITASALSGITDEEAIATLEAKASVLRSSAAIAARATFEKAEEDLNRLADFVRGPITIRIVDRAGTRTGVERTHDQSGSKSWYVVVEAVDAAGNVVPLDIHDRLTGDDRLTPVWGIRVPRETYLAVGEDKKDGTVDDNVAGTKPAGRMSIDWKITAFPGETIFAW